MRHNWTHPERDVSESRDRIVHSYQFPPIVSPLRALSLSLLRFRNYPFSREPSIRLPSGLYVTQLPAYTHTRTYSARYNKVTVLCVYRNFVKTNICNGKTYTIELFLKAYYHTKNLWKEMGECLPQQKLIILFYQNFLSFFLFNVRQKEVTAIAFSLSHLAYHICNVNKRCFR